VRTARIASFLALVVGIALGVFILFGPTYYGCSTSAVAPGFTPGPQTCHSASLVEVQGADHLFPAPLLWIMLWALAPALAVIGTWFGSRRSATALISAAILGDMTAIISFGGFLFAIVLVPLLLIALVATRRAPVGAPLQGGSLG